ncbi:hypothetical protein ABPG75_006460 [Micractinium tetrahymenae]
MAPTKHAVAAGYIAPHPSLRRDSLDVVGFLQQREEYSDKYLASLKSIHQPPRKWFELLAWWWLLAVRTVVGLLTGTAGRFRGGERQLARRAQMFNCDGQGTALSAVLVGHARSVVLNRPDNGWLHTLAMEVDCMRCQHAAWTELETPSLAWRLFDIFLTLNLLSQCCLVYLLAPSVIHSYQVYRAEEDIWWLSAALSMLDEPGRLPRWERRAAPAAARAYYGLGPDATVKDMLLRMRADEVCIRDINWRLAGLAPGTPSEAVAVRQLRA